MTSDSDPYAIPLPELLRVRGEPSQRVRLRIALDLLEHLTEAGAIALTPRSDDGLRLDSVALTAEGNARLSRLGDLSGAAVLVWEVLAGRAADEPVPPRLHDVVDEIHPDVDDALQRALGPRPSVTTLAELSAELSEAAAGSVGSYTDVRTELVGVATAPAPRPEPVELFGDDWEIPDIEREVTEALRTSAPAPEPPPAPEPEPIVDEEQRRITAVRKRAQERAAVVRASAEESAARMLAAEIAAAEAEAALREQAARAAAARAAAEAQEREREAAEAAGAAEALRDATERTAQLLSGALDSTRPRDDAHRTVLLIHANDAEATRLRAALQDAGFILVLRQDAAAAVAAAAWVNPVCIVCDYDLPDGSGDSMARLVRRKTSELALTPFILLASPADTRAGIARFAMGADVCMLKPCRPHEVVAQVRALVGMATRLRSARRALPTLEPTQTRGFAGDLVQMSITSMLTVLELERRTGVFSVESESRTARLEIVAGLLVGGVANGMTLPALGALRIMLAWKAGRFSFEPRPPRAPPAEATSITETLHAAMRLERAAPIRIDASSTLPPAAGHATAPPRSGVSAREAPDADGPRKKQR